MSQFHRLYIGAIFVALVAVTALRHQQSTVGNRSPNTVNSVPISYSNSDTANVSEAYSVSRTDVEASDGNEIVEPKTIRVPQFSEPNEAFRPEQAASKENIERFGEFEWPEAKNDTTLFFHRGHYIDAPYVVRTRGLAVFVNNHQVHVIEWPDTNFLAEKPPIPAGLTAESTPHDLVRGRRLRETWPILHARWVNTNFAPRPRETREEELVRRYKELPFVTETGIRIVKDDFVGERRILWFRTKTGEEKGIVSSATVPGNPPKDPELVLKDLQHVGNHYLQIIQSGYLEYRDGNLRTTVPKGSRAWLWLPEVFDVLDSDSSPSNKERKLRVLLNHETGAKGAEDSMISAWVSEFKATPQLRKRIEQIRRERTKSPKWRAPPALPEDVPAPQPEPQPDGPEHEARRNLDTAIAEMIELLEKEDFGNFVERYISPQYRGLYDYDGKTELNPSMNYHLNRQPHIVEMYAQNLRHAQQVEPIMEGNEAIFVHWFGRAPHEFHLKRIGHFWYLR